MITVKFDLIAIGLLLLIVWGLCSTLSRLGQPSACYPFAIALFITAALIARIVTHED